MNHTGYSLKYLLIGYVLIVTSVELRCFGQRIWRCFAPKPPLYGAYTVKSFVVNHDTVPPLTTDSTYRKHLIIQWASMHRSGFWTTLRADIRWPLTPQRTPVYLKQRLHTTNKSLLAYSMLMSLYASEGTIKKIRWWFCWIVKRTKLPVNEPRVSLINEYLKPVRLAFRLLVRWAPPRVFVFSRLAGNSFLFLAFFATMLDR